MVVTYNAWLIGLSYLIAVIASFTTLEIASRVALSPRHLAYYWVVGGAAVMGLGIWSMHFVGMLAFRLPIPIAYDFGITLISLVPAVLSSILALVVVRRSGRSTGSLAVSAIFMGSGIAAMHYTGMAAIPLQPVIRYDPVLVIASIVIAIAASFGALWLAIHVRSQEIGSTLAKRIGAALVMGFAIFGMHYTGMAAAEFAPGSICLSTPLDIDPALLAAMVAAGIITVLVLTVAFSMLDAWYERQKVTMARMRESESRHRAMVDVALDCIVAVDAEGRIREFNPAAEHTFGYSRAEILGQRLDTTLIPQSARAEHRTGWVRHLATGESTILGRRIEVLALCKDGTQIPIDLAIARTELNGQPMFVGHMRDLTESRRAQESLQLRSQAIEASGNAVVIAVSSQEGICIESVNPAFERITGYAPAETLGRTWDFLYDDESDKSAVASVREAVAQTREMRAQVRCKRKGGAQIWIDLFVAPVVDAGGRLTHWLAIMTEVTERVEQQQALRHQATHDTLTGLATRAVLKEQLQRSIALAERRSTPLEVVFIDVDHFKHVNDSLGHEGGDELLVTIARRIQACVRESDTVARFGGDEFVVVLHENAAAAGSAELIIARIVEALCAPAEVGGREVQISCSIGVSSYPRDGSNAELLLRRADAAMYHAKRRGRNNVQTFASEMEELVNERNELEWSLRKALSSNEFLVEYQPQVDLRTGRVTGVEALLRWRSARHGLVGPAVFIPIAEEAGLILAIGEWVLRTACTQIRIWQDAGLPAITVAVNVSARQLQGAGLENTIREVLVDTGMEPAQLELELTESLFAENTAEVVHALDRLKRTGVRLALDDFGTGYSNLGYLRRFPLDRIKMDRSFVANMALDRSGAAVAEAVVALGHSLELDVVAEGVESEAQAALLRLMGCDGAQGYHFCAPRTAEALRTILEAGKLPL